MNQPTEFIFNNAHPPWKALLIVGGIAVILPPIVAIAAGYDLPSVAPLGIGTTLVSGLIFVLYSLEFWREKQTVKTFFSNPFWATWNYDDCGIWFGQEGVYDEISGYTSVSNVTTISYRDHFVPPADNVGGFAVDGARKGPWITFHQDFSTNHGKIEKTFYYPVAAGHEVEAKEVVVRYQNKADQYKSRMVEFNL